MRRNIRVAAFLAAVMACSIPPVKDGSAQVVQTDPPEMQGIDVVEHYGERIPLDLEFVHSSGVRKSLGEYFNQGKPVVLMLAYYECEMLCTLVLNGMANGVRQLDLKPGADFTMLTVSIDPEETPELAAGKQHRYIESLHKGAGAVAWEFFVGGQDAIKILSDAVGFKYYYIPEKDEYAHPAVAFVLTEDGRISRYLYGLEFKPRDLRFSLIEASNGQIGTTLDRIILYCFHYDPEARGYVLFAQNVMKAGGVLVVAGIALLIGTLLRKERSRRPGPSATAPTSPAPDAALKELSEHHG